MSGEWGVGFSFSPREKVSRDATDEGLTPTAGPPLSSLRSLLEKRHWVFVWLTPNRSSPSPVCSAATLSLRERGE